MTKVIAEEAYFDRVRRIEDIIPGGFFLSNAELYISMENNESMKEVRALNFHRNNIYTKFKWGRKVTYLPEVKISYKKETL